MRVSFFAVLVAGGLTATPARAQSTPEMDATDAPPTADAYADTDPSALTDFRPALDPYGSWVDDPTYGTVWTPSPTQTGPGFQPYDTAGSWVYVDGDYVWVSDYAWGWICFHYGRWALSAGRWVWIAGRDYAGAWVSWSTGDSAYAYVGWAPMPPTFIWTGGSAVAVGLASPEPWAFAAYHDFLLPGVSSHIVARSGAADVAVHSKPYVPAQPSVATAPLSPSAPHGPPPAMLQIDVLRLALPGLGAQELRARQLARPSTAVALGVSPPARRVVPARPRPELSPRGPATEARTPVRGRR